MTIHSKRSERGQVLVLIVFGIIALVGIAALAVDGGNVLQDRRRAQNAADNAALASALARIRGENFVQRAYDSAAQNGFNNDGVTNSVQVFSPPIAGDHVDDIEYIQVIITSNVDTYFGGVIGRNVIVNKVSAVSRTKTPEVTQLLNGNAIVSLAPSSNCEDKKSFWLHGEATLDITGGGVFINSNNPDCALIEQGSGSIRIRNNFSISIVGGASIQKPHLLTPYPPLTGVSPIPYPTPFLMPKVHCDQEAKVNEDDETIMDAGSWSGDFPPEGVKTLNSGTYCINGDFIVDGESLNGTGVTIMVKNGEVRFNGHAEIYLTARQSGDYDGLLLYMPPENKHRLVLAGNADSHFTGTILAPGAAVTIKGSSSQYGFHSQIIGYTINVDGQSNTIIKYNDEQNYHAMTMPDIELTE